MPKHQETRYLPYTPEQMFDLVATIERYPEFLPWCKKAKIVEVISAHNLHADLLVNFKNFFEKYLGKLTLVCLQLH